MSTKTTAPRKWDDYAEEAKRPDFPLELSDGTIISIKNPTGTGTMRVSQGLRAGDLEVILMGLTGDAWPQVAPLLSNAGHGALPALVGDLMDHFGLYENVELVGPGGGIVTESRPEKVRNLLRVGYKILGETPGSRG